MSSVSATPGALPVVGDVLAEVMKALQALVGWTTQHWKDDVEWGKRTWSP